MSSYKEVLTRLGFANDLDPFQYQYGEDIPHEFLEQMWVPFSGGEKVLDLHQSTALLAPPGSGKTTWRRYVEKKIAEQFDRKSLVVVYDRFGFGLSSDSNINLDTHKNSLLRQVARSIFNYLEKNQLPTNNSHLHNWLCTFLVHFLPVLDQSRVAELLGLDTDASDSLSKWRTTSGLQTILLDELLPTLSYLGIERLYILLDGLDGLLETQNQEIMAALIKPLITIHPLLSDNRVVWKFFLPHNLFNTIQESSGYRTRRLEMFPIQWDALSLRKLLELRLDVASEKRIVDFAQLFKGEVVQEIDPAMELCQIALKADELGPPRALLRLGRQLFEQTSGALITPHEWDTFMEIVCQKSRQSTSETSPSNPQSGPGHQSPSPDTTIKLKLQISGPIRYNKFEVRVLESFSGGDSPGKGKAYRIPDLTLILEVLDMVARGKQRPDDGYYSKEDLIALKKHELLTGDGYFAIDLLEIVGQELYKRLFSDPQVYQISQSTLNLSHEQRKSLLFQLRFDNDIYELARYPWELLHSNNFRIALRQEIQFVRYITHDLAPSSLDVSPPMRLLYIQSRPKDLSIPADDSEIIAVSNALSERTNEKEIQIKTLFDPFWSNLLSSIIIYKPHIIHFDGHGNFGRICPNCEKIYPSNSKKCIPCHRILKKAKGFLAFEDESKNVDWVSSDDIGDLFNFAPELRLVVLSACRSSVARDAPLFSGVAPSLIRAGIPAVVGSQLPITFDDTIKFAVGFYNALAQYEPLPKAMTVGRLELMRTKSWFIPVLYLRSKDDEGRLFIKKS